MSLADLSQRFNEFQSVAIDAVVRDFTKYPDGRFLLVIPTGGGKTRTAATAISQLFTTGVLNKTAHRVLWVAHRQELVEQAREAFELIGHSISDSAHIKISTIQSGSFQEELENPRNRLVVIDEAHHGAANSYLPIFAQKGVGVLGLTATPSRHDGQSLEFERESYSIGFPDLVKIGVILRPEIVKVVGGQYETVTLDDEESLEVLNNKSRNQKIINHIVENKNNYIKIIVYVGTKNHVKSLYDDMRLSTLAEEFDSISYITGETNSRKLTRKEFIEEERKHKHSIIINVNILSEGYDDPKVNTVVMAAPTRSKLFYMQAIGRAIRNNPENLLKTAYIVEVEDELPNIRYRIDNRWLYSDISDALEPSVEDIEFSSQEDLNKKIEKLFERHNVIEELRTIPNFDKEDRLSLILFKTYRSPNNYQSVPIWLNRENRVRFSGTFNFFSERMVEYAKKEFNTNQIIKMSKTDPLEVFNNREIGRIAVDSMLNAGKIVGGLEYPNFVKDGYPWINYIGLRFIESESSIDDELLRFCEEMVNREEILALIRERNFNKGSYLCRFPLPLTSYVGKVLTENEKTEIEKVVTELSQLKIDLCMTDHRSQVRELLEGKILPIELAHSDSLVLIARENIQYYISLS